MTAKPNKPSTSKQYEELGRVVASIYENGYLSAPKSLRMSFLKGVAGGFGGVIGATIVVALMLWVLSFFDHIPLIGRFVETVDQTVQQSQ